MNNKEENEICPMSEGVKAAYDRGEEDENMEPIVLEENGNRPGAIGDNEYVIFYDIRGEREIELTQSFTEKDFSEFPRKDSSTAKFVTMVKYNNDLDVDVAFPPEEEIKDTLCEVISRNGLKQAKIVETEKAVHLSYFLNGKKSEAFEGEERIFIPSLKDITNYDDYPEMCIDKVTESVEECLNEDKYSFVIANFANVDVVGHIENETAVKKAVEAADNAIGKVVECAGKNGFASIITADHGTVEKWLYPEGAVDTGHTDCPVPFIIALPDESSGKAEISLRENAELCDVAPTVFDLMGIDKPSSMTGKSIITEKSYLPLKKHRKVLFLIADGWGYSEESEGNLIAQSNTPNMDKFMKNCPFTSVISSGEAVGMPAGTVGNSEVGHLHIGAGRRVYSDRLRIDNALEDKSFFDNPAFTKAMEESIKNNKPLHLLGIVSFYSSHGSINDLFGLMEMAKQKGVKDVYIHSFLGRRGERPESGRRYIRQVEEKAKELGVGKLVDVMGRFWSLDREENWDRIEKTYRTLAYREGIAVKA